MWRIMLCNPMKALLNQGCLNQWSFPARVGLRPVIGWKYLCGLWPLSHSYRELISECIMDYKGSDTTWELRMDRPKRWWFGSISNSQVKYTVKTTIKFNKLCISLKVMTYSQSNKLLFVTSLIVQLLIMDNFPCSYGCTYTLHQMPHDSGAANVQCSHKL